MAALAQLVAGRVCADVERRRRAQRPQIRGDGRDVHMRVDQPRQHEAAAQVTHLGIAGRGLRSRTGAPTVLRGLVFWYGAGIAAVLDPAAGRFMTVSFGLLRDLSTASVGGPLARPLSDDLRISRPILSRVA
jgi:hypothetical protein